MSESIKEIDLKNELAAILEDFFQRDSNCKKENFGLFPPLTVSKNKWYAGFGSINKKMNNNFDNLLFSVGNVLYFFDSFLVVKNIKTIKLKSGSTIWTTNKNHYVSQNIFEYKIKDNKYNVAIDSLDHEIVDYSELIKQNIEIESIIGNSGNYIKLKIGEKSFLFENQSNLLLNELFSIINKFGTENRDKEIDQRKNIELEEARLKEEERLEKLKVKQSNILAEFDKDGNGELDVVEVNNDFDRLVKKHQSKIIETDRSYIQHFVKVSNYQKTKRKNLQSIFNSISKTRDKKELSSQVELLKDQIHSYELILFHSLNMVTSLIEDDMFTFYEIYESFDKLEMFNSNHENEVSKRLINIEGGINDLMNSIRQMENNIIGELGYLSYVTQESYSELSHNVNKQLASIDSSIKANNLLTGINAYQTYKLRQGK